MGSKGIGDGILGFREVVSRVSEQFRVQEIRNLGFVFGKSVLGVMRFPLLGSGF